MFELTLTCEDNAAIADLAAAVATEHGSIEDPALARRAPLLARHLPPRLLDFLEDFRIGEPSAICRVAGLEIDQELIGRTPAHWQDSHVDSPALRYEIFFLLCASALGDVFGWATQQDGRIMHDVLPIRGHEHYEIGSNSLQPLSWHTEDAFHPCRGDYVALLCLRNPDLVETVVATSPDLDWEALDTEALFEPEFTIMPDNSHQPDNAKPSTGDADIDRLLANTFEQIRAWNENPEKRPILSGDPRDPYMALDPYHMNPDGWSARSQVAFKQLCDEIEAKLREVSLRPGDCLFLDNFRAVHGRNSFEARYDGSDRWLKRLNVTRNIRGSRARRPAPDHRIIH